jgi:hypothetical protein
MTEYLTCFPEDHGFVAAEGRARHHSLSSPLPAILLAFPDLGLWLACAYLTGDTGRLASLPKTRSMGATSAV